MRMAAGLFDLPQDVRDGAEMGIRQSLRVYEGFRDMTNEAAKRFEEKAGGATGAFVDTNKRAMQVADEGITSSFELASDLVKATSFQEAISLQTKFLQEQMQRFSDPRMFRGGYSRQDCIRRKWIGE